MLNFQKNKRLIKKSEFESVFKQGKKIVSEHFIFFYHKNNADNARLGLAISKKKIPQAHDRNRIKRLIRESFRCHPINHVDVVIIARKQITNEEDNLFLINQLGKIWDRLMTV